jgi:hypothetical protein
LSRKPIALALLLLAGAVAAGCRFHMSTVVDNRTLPLGRYSEILLGDDRRAVLERLGPPDRVEYVRNAFVFDYESAYHRGNELQLFLPSDVIPGFDPLFLLAIPRLFFDQSATPDAFRPTLAERVGRRGVSAVLRLVPFTSGEELLIVKGHKLRGDRLRVVFDRETLNVVGKSLRLATGEYAEESLSDRVLLLDGARKAAPTK